MKIKSLTTLSILTLFLPFSSIAVQFGCPKVLNNSLIKMSNNQVHEKNLELIMNSKFKPTAKSIVYRKNPNTKDIEEMNQHLAEVYTLIVKSGEVSEFELDKITELLVKKQVYFTSEIQERKNLSNHSPSLHRKYPSFLYSYPSWIIRFNLETGAVLYTEID